MWFSLKLGFRAFFGISRKNWDFRQNIWISGARGRPEIHKKSTKSHFFTKSQYLENHMGRALGQKFAPLVHLFHKATILRVKLLSKILCHHPLPLVRKPRLGITFHGCHLNYQPTLATMQRTSLAVVQEAFVP